jgi:hypothetical protein
MQSFHTENILGHTAADVGHCGACQRCSGIGQALNAA